MSAMHEMSVVRPRLAFTLITGACGFLLASCQQTPSVADVTEACKRANAAVTSVEFGEAYISTAPEKESGVPPNITIYPVKIGYRFQNLAGPEATPTVSRNLYTNLFGELVCD